MLMKVMVLGANGMAGHVICLGLIEDGNFEVIPVARFKGIFDNTRILDVSDFSSLLRLIEEECPHVIVNCVGILNQMAEANIDQAILLNSYLPHFLEAKTKNSGIKVIHISTDCVFSGIQGNYTEGSFTDGRDVYSRSKALGEVVNSKDLTLRTSIIGPDLNPNGIGLFNWFTRQNVSINGYSGAFWTGITTLELMRAVIAAISEDLCGLYHLVNSEKISKFDLLYLLNNVFDKRLNVVPHDAYFVDKSLINTRDDFSYKVPTYGGMINSMKEWIVRYSDFYPHYNYIIK